MKADRKKLEIAIAKACMNTEDVQKAAELSQPTLNNAKDIMAALEVSESKAYSIIPQLNEELAAKGCAGLCDIYILSKVQGANIDMKTLADALNATTAKRGSGTVIWQYRKILDQVRNSEIMMKQWENYRKDFEYVAGIEFSDTCDTAAALMEQLECFI